LNRRGAELTQRNGSGMFFFFSNKLGCLGSIVVSVVGTPILLALLHVI
jgi:hypothetical protein